MTSPVTGGVSDLSAEIDAIATCRHCGTKIVAHKGIGGVQWRDEHVPLGASCPKSPSHAHEPRVETGYVGGHHPDCPALYFIDHPQRCRCAFLVMLDRPCPKCGHTHVAGDAVALSRFAGVTGYRTPDGEIHATREDAQTWLCEQRQEAKHG